MVRVDKNKPAKGRERALYMVCGLTTSASALFSNESNGPDPADFHIKRTGLKKGVWHLFGCSASKVQQWGLCGSQFTFGTS